MSDQLSLIPSDTLTTAFEQLDPAARDRWLEIQMERKRERELREIRETTEVMRHQIEALTTQVEESARIRKSHVLGHQDRMNRTEFAAALPGGPSWGRATMLLQVVGIFTKSKHKPWVRSHEPIRPVSNPTIQNHVCVRDYHNAEFGSQVWEIDPDWTINRINEWMSERGLMVNYQNATRSQKAMHDFIDRLWMEYGQKKTA